MKPKKQVRKRVKPNKVQKVQPTKTVAPTTKVGMPKRMNYGQK